MSCFKRKHVRPSFDRERNHDIKDEANHHSTKSESGIGSKVLSFFKNVRITSVVHRMVSNSKTLLNRFASCRTTEERSNVSSERERKSYIPATETVTFPSHMVPTATMPATPSFECPTHMPNPAPLSITDPPLHPLHFNNVPPVIGIEHLHVDSNESSGCNDFRYKERKSSEITFPEIKKGIVSVRASWIGPILGGERADENESSLSVKGTKMHFSRNNNEKEQQAGAVHWLEERNITAKELPTSESDKESGFDEYKSFYKHRLPQEEREPWVEPGTVARGALWLEAILSGRKRLADIPQAEKHSSSPTRVAEVRFLN